MSVLPGGPGKTWESDGGVEKHGSRVVGWGETWMTTGEGKGETETDVYRDPPVDWHRHRSGRRG